MAESNQDWLCTTALTGTGDESKLDYFDLRACAYEAGANNPKEFALEYQVRVEQGEYGIEAAVNTSEKLHEDDASEVAETFIRELGSRYDELLTPEEAEERRREKFSLTEETPATPIS